MRYLGSLAVVAALVLFSAELSSLTEVLAQTTAQTGSISGQVTFVGGKPSPRRVVQYQPLGDRNAGSYVVTDLDGHYTIKDLADGVYLVGFFHPDRVPAQETKNQGVIADPNASPETIAQLGAAPVVKQVTIAGAQAVTGVDFVITDIGPETVRGPEVDGSDFDQPAGLPATGAFSDERDGSGRLIVLTVSVALLSLAILSGVVGRAVLAFRRRVQ